MPRTYVTKYFFDSIRVICDKMETYIDCAYSGKPMGGFGKIRSTKYYRIDFNKKQRLKVRMKYWASLDRYAYKKY